MPLYVVSHHTPLSTQQKDALAAAITKVHTTLFTTPSLFVNVRFEDINDVSYYVGGKRKQPNTINAYVRPGASRTREMYTTLCTSLQKEWDNVIGAGEGGLETVFVMGSIVAAYEKGFMVPEAGDDERWIRENMGEFERRAKEGDEELGELARECRERGLGGAGKV